jgi:FG-GAP repeat
MVRSCRRSALSWVTVLVIVMGLAESVHGVDRIHTLTAPGEALGQGLASLGDVDHDGVGDFAIGAPYAFLYQGRLLVISGATGSTHLDLGAPHTGTYFGCSVASIGDLDKDGTPDVLVGARGSSMSGKPMGYATVVSGADGSDLLTVRGATNREQFGSAVAGVGDLDGDGVPDLLVGAPGLGLENPGATRAFSGADGSPLAGHDLVGAGDQDAQGFAVAACGDLNADSVPDYVVGAPGWNGRRGRVLFVSGATGAVLRTVEGGSKRGEMGSSLCAIGDMDGDSIPDVAIGSPGADDGRGRVHVCSGATGKTLLTVRGRDDGDGFGIGVGAVGDVDGDGRPDLAATGRHWIVVAARREGEAAILLNHPGVPQDTFFAVTGVGDLNADAVPDLLVGSWTTGTAFVLALEPGPPPPVVFTKVKVKETLRRPTVPGTARGKVTLSAKKKICTFKVKVSGLVPGAYDVLLEDSPGAGTFTSIGAITVDADGAGSLSLVGDGRIPAALGVEALDDLVGRILLVRDSIGGDVCSLRLPDLVPAASSKSTTPLEPAAPPNPYPAASGKLKIRDEPASGRHRLELKVKKIPKSASLTLWMEDGPGSGTMVQVGDLEKLKLKRDTKKGDPLPFGVACGVDLAGRVVEVREGSTVILRGTIPLP